MEIKITFAEIQEQYLYTCTFGLPVLILKFTPGTGQDSESGIEIKSKVQIVDVQRV